MPFNGKMDSGPLQTICRHCKRVCATFAGGYAKVNGKHLCMPNVKGRPNCYMLVTQYGHETPCTNPLCYEDIPDSRGILEYSGEMNAATEEATISAT